MSDTFPRPWHRWRVTLTTKALGVNRFQRSPAPVPSAEPAAGEGIRHELVARIRQEIADGTYDTEEKWLAAEEALLRRMEART